MSAEGFLDLLLAVEAALADGRGHEIAKGLHGVRFAHGPEPVVGTLTGSHPLGSVGGQPRAKVVDGEPREEAFEEHLREEDQELTVWQPDHRGQPEGVEGPVRLELGIAAQDLVAHFLRREGEQPERGVNPRLRQREAQCGARHRILVLHLHDGPQGQANSDEVVEGDAGRLRE